MNLFLYHCFSPFVHFFRVYTRRSVFPLDVEPNGPPSMLLTYLLFDYSALKLPDLSLPE